MTSTKKTSSTPSLRLASGLVSICLIAKKIGLSERAVAASTICDFVS
jgi:hypothetical protein